MCQMSTVDCQLENVFDIGQKKWRPEAAGEHCFKPWGGLCKAKRWLGDTECCTKIQQALQLVLSGAVADDSTADLGQVDRYSVPILVSAFGT